MKLIKHYMSGIEGIGLYPSITLILFLLFFVAIAVLAFTANKKYIERVRMLPLEESEEDSKPHEKNLN